MRRSWDAAVAAERTAKDAAVAAKDEALAAERTAKDEALAAKDAALAAERTAKDAALAAERDAKDAALSAERAALTAERRVKDEVVDRAHAYELELQRTLPQLERLYVRFAFGAPPPARPRARVSRVLACGVCGEGAAAARRHTEHAANVARAETGNPKLSLTDAVLTFSAEEPARDRVFQRVRQRAPELPHSAVRRSFVALVQAAHQPHHEVLRQVSLRHPDVVFQNDTQRRAFEALCSLVDAPPPPPAGAAAAAGDDPPGAQPAASV